VLAESSEGGTVNAELVLSSGEDLHLDNLVQGYTTGTPFLEQAASARDHELVTDTAMVLPSRWIFLTIKLSIWVPGIVLLTPQTWCESGCSLASMLRTQATAVFILMLR